MHIYKILRPKLICFHFIGTAIKRAAREVWQNDWGEEETYIGAAARSQVHRRPVCQGSQETGKRYFDFLFCFVVAQYTVTGNLFL